MPNDESGPSLEQQMKTMGVCVTLAFRTFAVLPEVFLRHRFGREYLGLQAALAVVLILVWATQFPGPDAFALGVFLCVYLFTCGAHRVGAVLREARGQASHSRYTGRPRVLWFLPRWSEIAIKQWIEPPLVIAAGAGLMYLSVPLGSLIVLSAIGLAASVAIDLDYERRRAQELFDAQAEQNAMLERFRAMRGDAESTRSRTVVTATHGAQHKTYRNGSRS